jgi:hypothetical protein
VRGVLESWGPSVSQRGSVSLPYFLSLSLSLCPSLAGLIVLVWGWGPQPLCARVDFTCWLFEEGIPGEALRARWGPRGRGTGGRYSVHSEMHLPSTPRVGITEWHFVLVGNGWKAWGAYYLKKKKSHAMCVPRPCNKTQIPPLCHSVKSHIFLRTLKKIKGLASRKRTCIHPHEVVLHADARQGLQAQRQAGGPAAWGSAPTPPPQAKGTATTRTFTSYGMTSLSWCWPYSRQLWGPPWCPHWDNPSQAFGWVSWVWEWACCVDHAQLCRPLLTGWTGCHVWPLTPRSSDHTCLLTGRSRKKEQGTAQVRGSQPVAVLTCSSVSCPWTSGSEPVLGVFQREGRSGLLTACLLACLEVWPQIKAGPRCSLRSSPELTVPVRVMATKRGRKGAIGDRAQREASSLIGLFKIFNRSEVNLSW